MKPAQKNEWIDWLDDFGNLRHDAPLLIKEQYKKWKEQQAEWDRKNYEE